MSEKHVPNKSHSNNTIGNMIIESEINLNQEENLSENIQNINNHLSQNNNNKTINFVSFKVTKYNSDNNKTKQESSNNNIKLKEKNSLPLNNNTKGQKNKNIIEEKIEKNLSINLKNNQSYSSFNNQINDDQESINNNLIGQKINNNEINNEIEINNINIDTKENKANNEIILENEKMIDNTTDEKEENENQKPPSLTKKKYDKNNYNLIHMEYINDIWDSFIQKEKYNNYSFNNIIKIQTDIKVSMRCILIDWLISLQDKFFINSKTLFLTINLIDRYLSKKLIFRNKFQLLGVTALFIAMKYEEMYMKNITEFVNLTAQAFDKNEILNMENILIDLVDFNLDLPLSIDFFGVLSSVYEFNKEEYILGNFLLEAFLLDIECCKYKQSQIGLAACYIILGLRQVKYPNINGEVNFIKYYSELYKINFDIWKNYNLIVKCAENMYNFYEKSDEVKYREVYNLFNDLFI